MIRRPQAVPIWLLKWSLHMGIVGSVLPFFAKGAFVPWVAVVTLAALTSLASLLLGDLLILPRLGHKSGILGDFLIVYTVLWLGPALMYGMDAGRPYTFEGALLVATLAALAEFLFHPVVARAFGMRPAGLRS
ncbi:MAG: DUF2512 family protein [Clostridia bacterium]|nr:DUF2512 family protein [Clostridia bacterium]